MQTVYLETSFISACVTTRSHPSSVYRRETSLEWWKNHSHHYNCFISAEVLVELRHPSFPRNQEALALVEGLPLLPITDEVRGFARFLVREKAMPGPKSSGDAVHIAVATVYRLDYMVSWNVRHLANPSKVAHLTALCMRMSLIPPRILTPDLLWGANA